MSILKEIVENTRSKIILRKAERSLDVIQQILKESEIPKGSFKDSLKDKDEAIIAEIKKASPSAGIFAP